MLKTSPLTVGLLAMGAALALSGAARAADVTGLWHTTAQGGVIEIDPCGDSVCGKIVGSPELTAHPDLKDSRNGNPALRSRLLKGLVILQGFHRDGDGWSGGQLYNPPNGATYKGELRLTAPDTLKVTGCIVSPLCQTQIWSRAK